jgi:beta-phosphoglucomutase-like phosphatase (HAD superfamily)
MSRFQGMVFDFNGVLFWDNELQERAWREYSAVLRGVPFSDEEMRSHMHGRPNRYAFEYLLGRQIDFEELACFTDGKEGIYRRLCLDAGERFKLSPGAIGLLDFLAAHKIPRTIATAMERSNIDFFIRHFELLKWFEEPKIVYDDGALPGKPAPDVYLKACAKLALPPSACVVVEDSLSGMAAAKAAGIGCLIALGPKARHAELLQVPGVSFAVESLAQIDAGALFGS